MKWIEPIQKLKLHRSLWISHAAQQLLLLVFGAIAIFLLPYKDSDFSLGVVLGLLLAFLLILGLIMAWWFSRKATKPVYQLASALRASAQGDFDIRLPDDATNDMGLHTHFNQFMDQMNAFSDKLKVEIHERQLTDRALKESQALFDVFMTHLPALAIIKDAEGHYLYANAAYRSLLERAPEEVVGATDVDLWPAVYAEQIRAHDQQVMQNNQVLSTVEKIPSADGEHYQRVIRFPILDKGRPHMLAAIAFDITDKIQAEQEKVQLEQQLMQAQKMEAIGTLAGGIAHDFNNVLAAILGYVELAQLKTVQSQAVDDELEHVVNATHRAKDLVRQILTFSRKTEQDRQPLDPEPLIKEALKLLRASIPTTIDIQSQLNGDGGLIMANTTQLHQVVMNLCTNASHAMEAEGGTLHVDLHKKDLADSAAALKGVASGSYVELSIRDTGHGITQALQERIFDPYFTTKAKDKGTGMGLAVVHGIVKSHGGTILVESQPGQGTCFQVLFPVTTCTVQKDGNAVEALPKGDESVLFVDDEPYLVDLVQQMLARLGYRVTSCSDPILALEKVKQAPMLYDLVITDMTMPQMTGNELAARIITLRNDLPVVLCTGYSEQVATEKAAEVGLAAILMKPVTINDLAHVVRKVIDGCGSDKQTPAASPNIKALPH